MPPPLMTARFFISDSSRLALRSSTMLVSRLRRDSSASSPRWKPFLRSEAPPPPRLDMAGGWVGCVCAGARERKDEVEKRAVVFLLEMCLLVETVEK
jgi:hypothetical protein